MFRFALTLLLLLVFRPGSCQSKFLFALAGQSNAVGFGTRIGPLTQILPENGTCFEYLLQADKIAARKQDPIGEDVLVSENIPNYYLQKAQAVSAWPAFANRYLALQKSRGTQNPAVYLVQTAKGGTGCHEKAYNGTDYSYNTWSKEDLIFFKSVEKIKEAVKSTCLPLNGIIWLQGESDASAIRRKLISKEQYKQALLSVITRYREAFGPALKFYIIKTARAFLQLSNCQQPCAYNAAGYYFCCPADKPENGYDQVREAQEEIAQNDPFTFIIYDHPVSGATPSMNQIGYYHDGIHYQQSVYDTIGYHVAGKIYSIEQNNFRK